MRERLTEILRSFLQARGLVLLAVVAGVAGFMLARQYLQAADRGIAAKYAQAYEPRRVLVAAVPLAAGQTLASGQLAARNMPQRFLPSGAVAAESLDTILNAKLRVDLQPGDPLERGMLRSEAEPLAARLPTGTRGLTLGCDALGPLGTMLRAGDRLDLWLESELTEATRLAAPQVVSDIEVVASSIDAASQEDVESSASPCSLTLRVTPGEAGRLLAAAGNGAIAAVLRPRHEPAPDLTPSGLPQASRPPRRYVAGRAALSMLELLSADGQSLSRQWLAAAVSP